MLSGNLALIGFIVLTIYIIGMLFIGFYCNRKLSLIHIFPAVTFSETEKLNQGDEIIVDLQNGTIENLTTGQTYHGSRLPDHVLSIVEDGGLRNHLKRILGK